ncbi:MAG: aminotransferase class V-fold PLP-dependent enzyme [Ruminococcaceae bacterium]|nr:aminotransferase class V-fold PLP-dependent enzyme [Oscillospiraceae bacterium]
MIYLDSAATSFLKPPSVRAAVLSAMDSCASPGRGSHAAAMKAADTVLSCREAAASLLGVSEAERVVFTMNATHGLNIAIHSLIRPGMNVLISGYEHNAVTRPLHALGAKTLVATAPPFDREGILEAFRSRLPQVQAVICTHVSNVFGFVLPIEEIAALCKNAGVPLIVDAAQSAGILPLDFDALGCEFLACPGHKGLMGPQGTGLLLCRGETEPLLMGGTGSLSASQTMPPFLPDRLEAGTQNVPGIAGLLAGIRWVSNTGVEGIRCREDKQLAFFIKELEQLRGLRLFRSLDLSAQTGVLSVQHEQLAAEEWAERLGDRGIAVRAGLHCAPLAHESAGTLRGGTVRFSFSPLLGWGELKEAVRMVKEICKCGYKM